MIKQNQKIIYTTSKPLNPTGGFVGLKGDVNNDQFVNVIDVVQILQEILYNYYNFSESQFWGADIDYSNQLDVLDLTKLVEFILLHL